ncbi:WYL domain-containing protein [Vibrio sp. SCSIO 43136]|uniref:helix-turn-helix transcriptional regulator n=1 Tax=Vibrio sp. SCSIO 43136 TaxID=2819101 RepID=UPI00207630B1|nr:WYL domain-containing protein [Vibrio sp. SCSIO 43136]
MTVSQLANEVGASRRTILRDLNVLRDEGFVIHSDSGPGGGVQLEPQSVLTSSRLSVVEVFSMIISVTAVRSMGNVPFSSIADTGIEKIEKSLSSDQTKELRKLLECLYIGQLAPEVSQKNIGDLTPELLPMFETAFLEKRMLQFEYVDAKGAITMREVEPQAILILLPLLYLVAWDPSKEGFRHFRMDRIKSPQLVISKAFLRRGVIFDGTISQYKNLARFGHKV